MLEFISCFTPFILYFYYKKKNNLIDTIRESSIYFLCANFISFIIIKIIFKYYNIDFTLTFSIKYILLNIIIFIIYILYDKNFKINMLKNKLSKEKITKKKVFKKIGYYLILLLFLIFLFLSIYIKKSYVSITLDQIFNQLIIPLEGTDSNIIKRGAIYVLKFTIPIFLFILIIFETRFLERYNIEINIKTKKRKLTIHYIKNFYKKFLIIGTVTILIFELFYYHCFQFALNIITSSSFIEENYIDADNVKITTPSKKKNLIYIYMESMESTDVSEANGGIRNISLIPELEELALNNINFSANNGVGGSVETTGATWTAAALVSSTSGIPIKIPYGYDANKLTNYDEHFTNIITLGDLLEKDGYNEEIIFGSDEAFAGRGNYFKTHGNYKIFDLNYAKENGYISEDYNIDWWGFEDKKLYEFAKEELSELSKQEEPFNLTLLTVDTHPYGGYLDENCETSSDLTHYENTFKCASTMVNDFLNWLKEQSYYKDTVVIITGDHQNMIEDQIYENISEDTTHYLYNVYINTGIETNCSKNRDFTTFDYYPTTLAALGYTIEGNRLGLGTNLFSCEDTLLEKYPNLNDEINKRSTYYNKNIFN